MKKLLLVIAMVATSFVANAQFQLGANFGLPLGNASDNTTFAIGVEANYLFEASEQFKIGPSISYLHFFGKEVETPNLDSVPGGNIIGGLLGNIADNISTDISVLPISVAARFNASEKFVVGTDLGYALAIGSNATGGSFYYKPMVGYNFSKSVMAQLAYSGFDGASALTLGAVFSL